MVWKWSGPASQVQLTRTGPASDETQSLPGMWRVVSGTPSYLQLSEFLPGDRLQNYSGYIGTYSVVGDLVTITVPLATSALSTDRYRLTGQGLDATLVPLDPGPFPLLRPPTLRRVAAKP
jgi:hypothetical protein